MREIPQMSDAILIHDHKGWFVSDGIEWFRVLGVFRWVLGYVNYTMRRSILGVRKLGFHFSLFLQFFPPR